MYQDGGIWSKALETANENDRIHLRSTHYNYAKHLESKGIEQVKDSAMNKISEDFCIIWGKIYLEAYKA